MRRDRAQVVVEFGPGSGVFTSHILGKLGADARLIAFELNSELATLLRKNITDPRCIIVNRSAEHILETWRDLGESEADIILSVLSFSFLREIARERILKRTRTALRSGGSLITYQAFPKPPSGKRPLRRVVAKYFGKVRAEYEFRNIPPLEVLSAKKGSASKAGGLENNKLSYSAKK